MACTSRPEFCMPTPWVCRFCSRVCRKFCSVGVLEAEADEAALEAVGDSACIRFWNELCRFETLWLPLVLPLVEAVLELLPSTSCSRDCSCVEICPEPPW